MMAAPILQTDLVAYAALDMPTDDVSVVGGAINATMRVAFADLQPSGVPELILLSGGAGYRHPPTVVITPTGGDTPSVLATATAAVYGGLTQVTVTANGAGYVHAPTVMIIPQGGDTPTMPAQAVATVSGGSVQSITVTAAGSGYYNVPAISLLPAPADHITAPAFAAAAIGGQVALVALSNVGSGYLHVPSISFAPTGGDVPTILAVAVAVPDIIEVVSSSTLDTSQAVTILAMNSLGVVLSETRTLEGIIPVQFENFGQVNRIEQATINTTAAGTVTVRQTSDQTIFAQIPPGELGFTRLFLDVFADGLLPKTYYEKFFWKNTNSTTILLDPSLTVTANPTQQVTHCPAVVINDSGTATNRITAPLTSTLAPPQVFDDGTKDVPASLTPGQAIGVWLQLSLRPGQVPLRSSFSSELTGTTPGS